MNSDGVDFSQITITEFRGFRSTRTLRLGRITVLYGPNGFGKTTVFDAIDWALFGDKWRLGQDEDDPILNLWSAGTPMVSLQSSIGRLDRKGPSSTMSLDGHSFDLEE